MKYFTPELYNLGNSTNENDVDFSEDEWERAIKRYQRRWQKIAGAFPEGVRRFEEERVCLHDAEILRVARQGDTLVLVLETEPPALKTVVLTFTLEEEPSLEIVPLFGARQGAPIYWLYEEWNLDRRKRPTLEVLLRSGSILKLVFREFHYLVAEPLPLGVNGTSSHPTRTVVPASAR